MPIIGIIFVIIGTWLLLNLTNRSTVEALYASIGDNPYFNDSLRMLKFISILLIIGGLGLLL